MLRGVRAFSLNQYYVTFVYPAEVTCKHIGWDPLLKVCTNCTERNEEMISYVWWKINIYKHSHLEIVEYVQS